ncbi:hypothetical protein [Qipengyuania sp. JC766]|uniref:hypothetical protein n=1 Tax=Qipengyuania sp. JC766 TaxID=3232139 RepID=UPI0034592859
MYLSLWLAFFLPLLVPAGMALAMGLANAQLRQYPVSFWPGQLAIQMFFAAAAGVMLIIPNLAGALLANLVAAGDPVWWLAIYLLTFAALFMLPKRLFNNFFITMGGITTKVDAKVIVAIVLTIALSIALAAPVEAMQLG